MGVFFNNASDIIKSAATNSSTFIVFLVVAIVVLVCIYIYLPKKDWKSTTLIFSIIGLIIAFIIYLLLPVCWDGSRSKPCPPEPPPLCWDGTHSNPCSPPWESTSGFGLDRQGKKAKFNIYVLTNEYTWEINSSTKIRLGNGKESKNLKYLKTFLQYPDLETVLMKANNIISVGTASCEGNIGEEDRAFDRANSIQSLIKEIYKNRPSIPKYKKLNLGQFKGDGCNKLLPTAFQRSIIVIGANIIKDNEDVRVEEALHSFLKDIEKTEGLLFRFKVGDYSLFKFTY